MDHILFDWDGCLADTLSVWLESALKVFAEFGLHPTKQEITSHFGDWDISTKLGLDPRHKKAFIEKLSLLAGPRLTTVRLHEGVQSTLNLLYQQGKKMCIVTSSKRNLVIPALEHNNIQQYFDFILDGTDVVHRKPAPDVIRLALDKWSADNCLVVGDSDKDILAGKAAGVKTLLFYPPINRSYYSEEDLKSLQPDYFISEFSEIKNIV